MVSDQSKRSKYIVVPFVDKTHRKSGIPAFSRSLAVFCSLVNDTGVFEVFPKPRRAFGSAISILAEARGKGTWVLPVLFVVFCNVQRFIFAFKMLQMPYFKDTISNGCYEWVLNFSLMLFLLRCFVLEEPFYKHFLYDKNTK